MTHFLFFAAGFIIALIVILIILVGIVDDVFKGICNVFANRT